MQASVAGLQSLQGAARLTGATAGAMTGSLQALGDNLYDAVGGRAPQVVVALQTLGIAFRNADGSARKAAEVMPEVADKIAAIGDPRTQAQVLRMLGISEELLSIMRRGAAGLREAQAEAARLGAMNEAAVEMARRYQEAQTLVALVAEGVGHAVAARLAPVLIPLLDRLAAWIAAHSVEITAFFEHVAASFARWVDAGGIETAVTARQWLCWAGCRTRPACCWPSWPGAGPSAWWAAWRVSRRRWLASRVRCRRALPAAMRLRRGLRRAGPSVRPKGGQTGLVGQR